MKLDKPVTLYRSDSTTIVVDSLNIIFMDNSLQKIVIARLFPLKSPVVLWEGVEYDNIGDYTQSQIEDKIKQLMGDHTEAFLQTLLN